MDNFGYIKVCASTFSAKTGDIEHNKNCIINEIKSANAQNCALLVLPRHSITGGNAGDLFFNNGFMSKIQNAFAEITSIVAEREIVVVLGSVLKHYNSIYECAFVLSNGGIEAIIPNNQIQSDQLRYFSKWAGEYDEIDYCSYSTPFAPNIMVQLSKANIRFGIDFSNNFNGSYELSNNGANLVINMAQVQNLYDTQNILTSCVLANSYNNKTANIFVGSVKNASKTSAILNSNLYIAECGTVLSYREGFEENNSCVAFLDTELINSKRRDISVEQSYNYDLVLIDIKPSIRGFDRQINANPYVITDSKHLENIFNILTQSLFDRVNHTQSKAIVLGVSGGLDSTLSLIILYKLCRQFNYPIHNIKAVSMPFTTSSARTQSNARKIITGFGFECEEINISGAINSHLADIKHNGEEDIAYENSQARERTQILMDLANMHSGIMVGTSDMSEEALGFSTFGGDAISMYNILSGVPKTTVKCLVEWFANNHATEELSTTLLDIVNTPISPELKSNQTTEDYIGPYAVHDFYLHNLIENGFSYDKTLFLAQTAFSDYSKLQLKEFLNTFAKRFVLSQYKRNVSPASVKIFNVNLSQFDYQLSDEVCLNALQNEKNN